MISGLRIKRQHRNKAGPGSRFVPAARSLGALERHRDFYDNFRAGSKD